MKDFISPFLGFRPGTKISSILLAAVLFEAAFCPFLRGFFGSGPLTGPCPAKRLLFLGLAFALAFGFFVPAGFFFFFWPGLPQRHSANAFPALEHDADDFFIYL